MSWWKDMVCIRNVCYIIVNFICIIKTFLIIDIAINQFYILEEMFGDDMKHEHLNLKKYLISQYLLLYLGYIKFYLFTLNLHVTEKNFDGKIWFILIPMHRKQYHWKFQSRKLLTTY